MVMPAELNTGWAKKVSPYWSINKSYNLPTKLLFRQSWMSNKPLR